MRHLQENKSRPDEGHSGGSVGGFRIIVVCMLERDQWLCWLCAARRVLLGSQL